jgi:flagellar assembly factor FliW
MKIVSNDYKQTRYVIISEFIMKTDYNMALYENLARLKEIQCSCNSNILTVTLLKVLLYQW